MTFPCLCRFPLRAVATVAILVSAACATSPKPAELDAFETLRRDPGAPAASRKAPDLMAAVERLFLDSEAQWKDNNLEESRNSALMGQIKLKHALALTAQDTAKKQLETVDEQLSTAENEQTRLQRDLVAANDQVALLKKLNDAAAERQKLTEQLSAAQQKAVAEKQNMADQLAAERVKASAGEKISEAELALKASDTVQAATYAKSSYEAAADTLARARQEFSQGNFAAAETSADLARAKAQQATDAAKPVYTQEAQGAQNKALAETLSRDAAALSQIAVRRDVRGSLQRLVLPILSSDLFVRRDTTIAPGRDMLLEGVAALLKKYPTFPVQVVGYTDTRGRAGELLALSLARAQSVFSALVIRGVDAKRMLVSGQGGAEAVADNRTTAGRAQNNRVEIVFLYQ